VGARRQNNFSKVLMRLGSILPCKHLFTQKPGFSYSDREVSGYFLRIFSYVDVNIDANIHQN
jgi:hypothetical protein